MTPDLRSPVLLGMGFVLAAAFACRAAAPIESTPQGPAHPAEVHALRVDRALAAGERALPRPTEHLLDEGAEARHKRARKDWMREMHRAAPGVDWQAIERENGEREMARRAALQAQGETQLGLPLWTEVGSRNQAGRMHWAAPSPDGTQLYGASSLGGVWRAGADGSGWVPLGDNLYGGSRRLVVVPGLTPADPDAILSATSGNQVRLSRDEGATWSVPSGLGNFQSIRALEVLQDASMTIVALGRSGGQARLWASSDGGQSFQVRWTASSDGNSSLFVPRFGAGSADTIYLLHNGRLHVSTDLGFNFTQRSTLDGAATDGWLVGSEAGAPTLYASLRTGNAWRLHRSDDAGVSWTFVNDMSGYWSALEASSSDPLLVSYGGVECWRSTNGGASFTRVNGWGEYYGDPLNKLHADIQGLVCLPDPAAPGVGETWYVCTDGGLYASTDLLQSVTNLSLDGLGVSQYYATHTSSADNARIAAGSQDQGYQIGALQASTGPGPSTDFDQVISGDYGHLTSGDGTHALVYSTYPGFILVQEGETNPILRTLEFPSGANHLWLPPVVADPMDPEHVFFLGDRLWRYERVSSSGWSRQQHSAQSFDGGNASYLTALAFAPSDPSRAYAVNDRGRYFVSDDHGVSWSQAPDNGPNSHYFYGNALCVNPVVPDEAFSGGSGYSGPGVWRTTDGGASWQAASSGLPSTLVYDLAYAGDGSGDVFAATEAGAWHFDRTTDTWSNVMQPATPLTLYWSVEAVPGTAPDEALMRFGTYGRGIWDYRIPQGSNGSWASYDEGVGVANTLTLSSPTAPNVGQALRFEVSGAVLAPSGTSGWLLAGRLRAQLPAFGGVQLVDQVVRVFPLVEDGQTAEGLDLYTFQFVLPDLPVLIATAFRFQAVIPDATVPGGHALSNGLEAVFGQ